MNKFIATASSEMKNSIKFFFLNNYFKQLQNALNVHINIFTMTSSSIYSLSGQDCY